MTITPSCQGLTLASTGLGQVTSNDDLARPGATRGSRRVRDRVDAKVKPWHDRMDA